MNIKLKLKTSATNHAPVSVGSAPFYTFCAYIKICSGEPVQRGLQCSVVQQHERVYFYTDHFNNIILPPVLFLH